MSSFRRRLMMAQGGGGGKVGLDPSEAPEGVYIQHIDGSLVANGNWIYDNSLANGVAVISNLHPQRGFVIAKTHCIDKKRWGKNNNYIYNVFTSNDINIAKTDYNGYNNTDEIISSDSDADAAIYCRNYIFPNGKNGYLGALGEFYLFYDNFYDVSSCMSKIGGEDILDDYDRWTSTQSDSSTAWYAYFYLNPNFSTNYKHEKNHVRAFTSL